MPKIMRLSGHIYVFNKGKVIASGAPEEVRSNDQSSCGCVSWMRMRRAALVPLLTAIYDIPELTSLLHSRTSPSLFPLRSPSQQQ